jgi:dTDP-4-dehydrorhamnose reductase
MEHGADFSCDLTDPLAASEMILRASPDHIIHLVSLTSVDLCERNPQLAYEVNVQTVENVTQTMSRNPKCHLLYVSTDHVYDSPGDNPEERICLRNTYALTKLWAEQVALGVEATVLRTNFFGRSHTPWRKSFSDWVRDALVDPSRITLLTDVYFSPLSIETLSAVIARALIHKPVGVYNAGSRGGMSKRDFVHSVAEELGGTLEGARDGRQGDVELDALRPVGMMMDSERLEKVLDMKLPSLADEIRTAEL